MADYELAADDLQVREDLKNLSQFVEQLLGTRDKIVCNIDDYPICLLRHDLLGDDGAPLPGISFGPTEDAWLSFERLADIAPPATPADLARWLRWPDPQPTPNRPPVLLPQQMVQVSAEQASELIEAGLVQAGGEAPIRGSRGEIDGWAVWLDPADLPSVTQALAAYLNGPWQSWAAAEIPRRRTTALYQRLYKAQADVTAAADDGSGEVIVGIGLAQWQVGDQTLRIPLIEQRAEFELDQADGRLSVLPRAVPPVPALAAFQRLDIPAAAELQRDLRAQLEAIARDPDLTFSPFHPPSFLGLLETCAARLDASGIVLDADPGPQPPDATLRISPGFCLIIRRRRDDVMRDDLRRLSDRVLHDPAPLPPIARRFVTAPPDALPDAAPAAHGSLLAGVGEVSWHNGASDPSGATPARLFFPLAANAEQEDIARRLDQDGVHGVVVQGPPGTGKTHTIANIIGHAMARGQRVLVSAHTAEALTAIRDKLPPSLRDLAIAITHSDRAGARQLEEAVRALSDRVQAIHPHETARRIDELLHGIDRADAEMLRIDAELAAVAQANETELPWRGGLARPQAIAAWLCAEGRRHDWLCDKLDLTPAYEPRFDEAAIAEARALRRRLGADLGYRADDLAAGAALLPPLGAVVAAHRALREAAQRQEQERDGRLPKPDLSATDPGELAELLDWLVRLQAWRDGCHEHPWLPAAWETLAIGRPADRPGQGLRERLATAALLAERGNSLALAALILPDIAEADRLTEALMLLAVGRKPFGVLAGRRHNPVKDAISAARVAGEVPADGAGWRKLAELHAWRRETGRFVAQWNEFAVLHQLTPLPGPPDAARRALHALGTQANTMLTLMTHAHRWIERLGAFFPYGLDASAVVLRIDVTVAVAAIRANASHAELATAERVRDELRAAGSRIGGELADALADWADHLGSPAFNAARVAADWRVLQAEVARLATVAPELRRLDELAALVRASGAGRWAGRIRTQPADPPDPVLPADWRDAWDRARAAGLLARVADRPASQRLAACRAELGTARQRHFLEVIEKRTFLALRAGLTESVLAAISKFLAAIARLPKNANAKTAARQRRIVRDSLAVAARAIPCWIMPEWRVAEQLPADLGSFDLVIIDEASQSNITALPVLLRGKKLLVVGDDRQVSPDTVGIEEAAIDRLRRAHLRGQPLEHQMHPATSLYELAGMIFPGRVIVLREHFRCVEPIIRFSSRFYNGQLVPLRLPKPSERIDPPLVDILVEDGSRAGDVNRAEAAVIVREIQALISDPALNAAGRRSIGVISLHSGLQANLIHKQLVATIGPRAMDDHRILCGDAATFQGHERDIILLSMVHDERTARKQAMRMIEQRYNVALSRARDRMVLVRSLNAAMLKEGDIKLEVLRHFQDPMAGGRIAQNTDLLAACESGFERQVGERLLAAGYRLRAQVPAGGCRIDFVVEGVGDTRLAIELDGDAFHGPGRWAHDIRRQQALERVGWVFWRCWASEWFADRDAVMRDLVATLERRGITPIGALTVAGPALVEFRSVRHAPEAVAIPAPGQAAAPEERVAIVGDTVLVRYAGGRRRLVHIVTDGTADGRDRIAPGSPMARAVLGLRVGDEADYVTDNGAETLSIETICPVYSNGKFR